MMRANIYSPEQKRFILEINIERISHAELQRTSYYISMIIWGRCSKLNATM